ncbi:peptidoglycan DD-metalloendopeptidase family protein [Glutamicibacter protophormiae]|uniref:aggregation-promoting factor C-terminal-like domain-containing protein n=1 Tax=Glutamicibacter protophormiae TaxID=37930 RepID=UPI003A907C77
MRGVAFAVSRQGVSMPIIGIAQLLIEPVSTGLQQKVSREVGRVMPRAGREAGQKLGRGMAEGFSAETATLEAEVNQLSGALNKAESDLAASKARTKAARDAEAKSLGDIRVAELKLAEVRDSSNAKASQIAAAEEKLNVLRAKSVDIIGRRETAEANLARSTTLFNDAQRESSRASSDLESHMLRLNNESENTERGVGRLGDRLRNAFHGSPLAGMVASIRNDSTRINVDLHQMANDVSNAGTRGGRAFTTAFIGVVGGLSAVTPAAGAAGAALLGVSGNAITLAASLGKLGGVAALVPAGLMAIGGGAGVMVAAFSGVGDALKAVTDQQDAFVANPRIAAMAVEDALRSITVAEENAARAQESAARRVSDAKRSLQDTIRAVADAEKSAAEAIESATRRVQDAKESLKDTLENVAEAQERAARSVIKAERREADAAKQVLQAQRELADARKKAIDLAESLAKKQQAADFKAIDTALALKRSHEELEAAKADPKSPATLLAQLEHNAVKALARDEAAKKAVQDLAAERKKAATGSDAVLAAEERVERARQAQADASADIADAKKAEVKQREDGAKQISRAERSVSDAVSGQKKAQEDASKSASDGARQIADAQRAVSDAMVEAKRSQVDSARAVADAHRGLERVQMQQADAAARAGDASAKAMEDLTPSAREAVRALLTVKDQLGGIRRIAQENFFKGFASPLLNLAKVVMPQLATGVGAIASALGAGAQQTMNSLSDALGGGVLTGLLTGIADTITIMNQAIDPLVQSFVTLGVVGMEYMPRFATAVSDLATGFNAFIQDAAASGELNVWIENGIQAFKDLGSIVGSVAGIFGSLNQAAEAGGAVSTLGGLAQGLRDIDAAMQGETFQTTMSTIFAGAEAGSQGLLSALTKINEAFVVGAPAFADFLRLGGEIAGTFVGGIFTALSNPEFGAGLTKFLEHVQAGVEDMVPLLPGLTGAFGAFLESLGPIVQNLGPSLIKVFTGFGESIAAVIGFFDPLLSLIAGSPAVLGLLIGSFVATKAASAALTAAGNVQKIVMFAWSVATKAVTAATWLANVAFKALNATFKANPIMFIVTLITGLVAAIVWLYRNNETARQIIDGAWNGIKLAIKVAWEGFIKPAVNAIVVAFKGLGAAIKLAWDTVIKPAFNALGSFFKWVWDTVLKPAFDSVLAFWRDTLAASLKWTWENVLKPVFSALGSFFKWTWENVLKPAFGAVKSAWKGLSDRISYVYDTFIKPVFDTFGKLLKGDFVGAFQTAKDAVKKIWDDIKGVVKKPIEFVVNKVINDGLIGAVNTVTGFIDPDHKIIPKIGTVNLPEGFASGGWTGPGARLDPAGIVHADEFVVKKSSRRRFERENPGLLDHVNRTGSMAGYASGGLVRPVKGGSLTSGFGASRGRYPHAGIDFAVPIGTAVYAAMDGTVLGHQPTGRTGRYVFLSHPGNRNTYYGHLSQPLVQPGQQVTKGQQIALSGNTGRSTGPHLHWETWTGGKPVNPAAYLNGAILPEGGATGGGFNPLQALVDFKDSIVGRFADAFSGGGMFADLAQGAGTKLTSDILGWFPAQMAKIGDFGQDVWGNTKDFFNGKDSDVQAAVRGVAAGYGWDSGRHWDALSKLIAKESSWDPNAQNKTSTAYGLFQFLNSTWGSYGSKTSDPAGQARAGMKYIQDRYGDPEKAWAFHKRNNWYAEGGLVKPILHDNGGVLNPGLSAILNASGKPEAILSNRQWNSTIKAIEYTVAQGRGNDSGKVSVTVVAPEQATATEFFNTAKHELAVMNRRGGRR